MNFYSQVQESSFAPLFVQPEMLQMMDAYSFGVCLANQYSDLLQSYVAQFCFCDSDDCVYDCFDVASTKAAKCSDAAKKKAKKSLMLKKANLELNADDLLRTLLMIKSENTVLVSGKRKAESKEGPLSDTRSAFIGVSRNGFNWQALIAINKRKTYIGSYESEKDAAMAFDFYSIMLHSLTAKTNFSYTKEDIINMISNYKRNNDVFIPEEFHYL